MTRSGTAVTLHPLTALTDGDRLRVSWFKARHLDGLHDGKQVWVLEALTSMDDHPVGDAVFTFDGPFTTAGTVAANRQITRAGFTPANRWHLGHDTSTWILDALRPNDTHAPTPDQPTPH